MILVIVTIIITTPISVVTIIIIVIIISVIRSSPAVKAEDGFQAPEQRLPTVDDSVLQGRWDPRLIRLL